MDSEIRTPKQNDALQVYCRGLAAMLNERGISFKEFFDNLESEYTEEMIRNLFRKKGKTKYGKAKTSTFNKKELQVIYEELNKHVSQFGIYLEWPSEEGKAISEGKIY